MERPISNSKGSGGLVRVSPIGLLFYKDPEKAFRYGCELAAFTHGHPSGYLPAGFLAALLAFINRGHTMNQAIDLTTPILLRYPKHEETLKAIQKALKLQTNSDPTPEGLDKLGSGRTGEEALAMAIFCAYRFRDSDFERALAFGKSRRGYRYRRSNRRESTRVAST
jgi:ADP-ribosyl-[dinitrogen reductase] hydrolase